MILSSLVSTFLAKATKTNLGRTVSHAVLAFAAVFVPSLVFTSISDLKIAAIAAFPAAAAALFRTIFTNDPAPVPPVVISPPAPVDVLPSAAPPVIPTPPPAP